MVTIAREIQGIQIVEKEIVDADILVLIKEPYFDVYSLKVKDYYEITMDLNVRIDIGTKVHGVPKKTKVDI